MLGRKLALALSLAVCVVALVATYAFGADDAKQAQVERGRHLVMTSGCTDCHTPWKMGPNGPEPDWERNLSGHPQDLQMPPAPPPQGPWLGSYSSTFTAWSGPWGVSFTANITPDKETGIGEWTEENFVQSIRSGKHMGKGRAILPPMPYPVYNNMPDEDLKAIYAYLMSIPPIKNKVPEPVAPPAPPAGK